MAFSSLQVGANAVQSHDKAMGVIGDNIANTNTLAYKGSSVHFGDMLAQSIGTSAATGLNQIGTGSSVNSVNPRFDQGSFRGTSQNTDMAIDGEGFFKLRQPEANDEQQSLANYYTRAGNFTVDKEGFLVGPEGARVQGWQAQKVDGEFTVQGNTANVGDINIDEVSNTAQATENINPKINLDATASATQRDTAIMGTQTNGSGEVNAGINDPNDAGVMNDGGGTVEFEYDSQTYTYNVQGGESLNDLIDRINGGKDNSGTPKQAPQEVTASLKVIDGEGDGNGGTGYALKLEGDSTSPGAQELTINSNDIFSGTEGSDGNPGPETIWAENTFDPTDQSTYNFKTEATVYDSQGAEHIVSLYYGKSAENQWNWHAVAKGDEVDNPQKSWTTQTGDTLAQVGMGSMAFDGDGALQRENTVAGNNDSTLEIDWANGSNPNPPNPNTSEITLDHGTPPNDGNGLNGVTQRAGDSVVYSKEVDGRPTGSLKSFNVNDEGVLVGSFDNGSTQPLAKIALYDVPNQDALTRQGGNKYTLSSQSGEAVLHEPGTGGVGTIRGFSLEESNVKASEQFTRMIAIQRGYQANTKTIQTVDEMLQQLMRIK